MVNVLDLQTIRSSSKLFFFFLPFLSRSSCAEEDIHMCPFSICPPVGSHIAFSGRLCMLARSVCFSTPRLSLGHPGSFTSVHDLKCTRTQTASLSNAPRGRLKYLSQGPGQGSNPRPSDYESDTLSTRPPRPY